MNSQTDETSKLNARISELEYFVQEIRDGFDCDEDAHKYGTFCRCCEATKLLNDPNKLWCQEPETFAGLRETIKKLHEENWKNLATRVRLTDALKKLQFHLYKQETEGLTAEQLKSFAPSEMLKLVDDTLGYRFQDLVFCNCGNHENHD